MIMKKRISTFYKYLSVVVLTLILSSCSTTKNTVLHRGWHNMNSRYKGYFYSKEMFKERVKKIEKANKDGEFRKLLLDDPVEAIKQFGVTLPDSVKVKVVEEGKGELILTMPASHTSDELSELELLNAAGGSLSNIQGGASGN